MHKLKTKTYVKMKYWHKIISFSISGCKNAEMAIMLAGILSEDHKMSVAKDI